MSGHETLYSIFRREKRRQYENLQKHKGGILSALVFTATTIALVRNISLDLPTNVHSKIPLNFTDLRECLPPSENSRLVKIAGECVYVYSIIANYRDHSSLLTVTLNVWDGAYTESPNFLCCLRSEPHDVFSVTPSRFNSHHVESSFRAGQYDCLVDTANNFRPTHMALATKSCSQLDTRWMEIEYAKSSIDQLAICTGVTHGQIIPEILTEWFELQKILGIEKIVTYVHDLQGDREKILTHYRDEGLLEILWYDIPGSIKAKGDRGLEAENRWYPQYYNDIEVALLDCQERLRGYKYLIVNKFNEFFIPSGEILNLYDLLEYRLKVEHQVASSFAFPVKTFITEWSKSDPDNELYHLQYLLRAPLNRTQTRSIYIPSRILSLSAPYSNQYCYQSVQISEDIASFHEYRDCEQNEDQCYSPSKYHDGDLFAFEKILKEKMNDVNPEFRREF
ncbi:hypothetical protein LOTGIDRAFT_171688 [Lottia gigantea]|uniref:Glycosyltransferase family 92 protein n=1 Tax=Lottia gigantea TaxID=225164 RepID=V4AZN1_LOTGI|nr:hypothetical protein LOTGIDRAFT_171688 [Lottia gigantea]ESP03203.1 hypothetical protein LOTGIDRAFT_171688 [Lottia gigantea]